MCVCTLLGGTLYVCLCIAREDIAGFLLTEIG